MTKERERNRKDLTGEVEEELRLHIQMRAEENERSGMSREEARREAERAFGDYRRIARASLYERLAPRDPGVSGSSGRPLAAFLDTLYQDLRQTLRGMAQQPGLWVAGLLTLAIGIGATTAMYSLANWVLLRPIPGVASPADLSQVRVGQMTPSGAYRPRFLSVPNFNDIAARMTTTEGLAYFQLADASLAYGNNGAESARAAVVSPSYFDVLGLRLALGRDFTEAEGVPGADASVLIISHGLWASRYDRDPGVLGKALRVNGIPFTIVGVAPEGFEGTRLFEGVEFWIPGSAYALIRHSEDSEQYARREAGFFYTLVARRAEGVAWSQVAAEFDSLKAWLVEQYPGMREQFAEDGFYVLGNLQIGGDDLRQMLVLLLLGSALVLLIACANVANLLLIRGLGRRSEVALRRALGCQRVRLFRQHLTEGIVLWVLGGLAGVGVARLLVSIFEGAPIGSAEIAAVVLDTRVLVFAAGTTLLAATLFASFPALAAQRVEATASLKGAAATAGRRRLWARGTLTAVQLAASVTLFVGALLLTQTLLNLTAVDPGFDPDGVYTFSGNTWPMSYTQQDTFAYFAEFERQLRLRPEITEVAVAGSAPLQRVVLLSRVYPADADPEESAVDVRTNVLWSPAYFDLFGIPLLRGRSFSRDEIKAPGQESPPIVILSETLARQLFGSIDVIGRAVAFPFQSRQGRPYEVIGVAGDVLHGDISTPPGPLVYEPGGADTFAGYQHAIAVHSTSPAQIADIAREVSASIDDALPVGEVHSMDDLLADARSQWTLLTKLMVLLAVFAAVLSAVGLYGVIAFMVRARTREIGIRVALGASTRRVVRLVLRSITVTTGAGLLLGLIGAIGLVRILESRLYGVAPFDPGVWAVAAASMVVISLAAAFVPARRATRVDPAGALRSL